MSAAGAVDTLRTDTGESVHPRRRRITIIIGMPYRRFHGRGRRAARSRRGAEVAAAHGFSEESHTIEIFGNVRDLRGKRLVHQRTAHVGTRGQHQQDQRAQRVVGEPAARKNRSAAALRVFRGSFDQGHRAAWCACSVIWSNRRVQRQFPGEDCDSESTPVPRRWRPPAGSSTCRRAAPGQRRRPLRGST